jgi:hypothetical protein
LVSTSVKSVLAARQRHDGAGAKPFARVTAQAGEPARPLLPTYFDEDDTTIRRPLKIDRAARFDAKQVADELWDRDLPFARNRRRHLGPVMRCFN